MPTAPEKKKATRTETVETCIVYPFAVTVIARGEIGTTFAISTPYYVLVIVMFPLIARLADHWTGADPMISPSIFRFETTTAALATTFVPNVKATVPAAVVGLRALAHVQLPYPVSGMFAQPIKPPSICLRR